MKEYLFIGILISIIALSGCITPPDDDAEIYTLRGEGVLPEKYCTAELASSMIYFHSEYCHYCHNDIPKVEEIEETTDVPVIYLSLSDSEDMRIVKEHGFIAQYTPTTVIGCNVYIGAKDKSFYEEKIKELENEEKE